MTDRTSRGQWCRMMTGCVMLASFALLASVASAAAQSKGYRPPPPPPPMPPPSAPAAPPPRTTTSLPPRSQGLTPSGPSSPAPKPSAPVSPPKGGTPPKGVTTPKGGTPPKPPDFAKMNPSELQKSIGSDTRQIDAYRSKVNNPRASQPNWNSLSRDQQGALMRQWNDEIRRHEASRATAQKMLSQKTR